MKLWKENRIDKEWELSNKEIADRFLRSKYSLRPFHTERALVDFITAKDGLNSIWDWDKTKGSVMGSKDMLEILTLIEEDGKK